MYLLDVLFYDQNLMSLDFFVKGAWRIRTRRWIFEL